jgi:uncharacterized membrane protein YbhN (UPF0104 family)
MDGLRRLARSRRVRITVAVVVIIVTLCLFGYYLATHPDMFSIVLSLSPLTVLLLTLAYIITILANAFVLKASLKLIKTPVGLAENIALTGYSSVVNFFGPLQSGPGFRAVYLKQRHGVSLKKFLSVTVLFYGWFALVNGLVLVVALLFTASDAAILPLTLGVVVVSGLLLCLVLLRVPRIASTLRSVRFADRNVLYIGLGAILLSAATAAAYHLELTHVDAGIAPYQSIVYAAAANLALFVSLTPGAIGFRESFLLLSQQLHGIATDTVIAASIIDRAFYVMFLLALFVVLLLLGGRSRFKQIKAH